MMYSICDSRRSSMREKSSSLYGQADGSHPCCAGKAWLTGVKGFAWSMRTWAKAGGNPEGQSGEVLQDQTSRFFKIMPFKSLQMFNLYMLVSSFCSSKIEITCPAYTPHLLSMRAINRHAHKHAPLHDLLKNLTATAQRQLTSTAHGDHRFFPVDRLSKDLVERRSWKSPPFFEGQPCTQYNSYIKGQHLKLPKLCTCVHSVYNMFAFTLI